MRSLTLVLVLTCLTKTGVTFRILPTYPAKNIFRAKTRLKGREGGRGGGEERDGGCSSERLKGGMSEEDENLDPRYGNCQCQFLHILHIDSAVRFN